MGACAFREQNYNTLLLLLLIEQLIFVRIKYFDILCGNCKYVNNIYLVSYYNIRRLKTC